MKELKVEPGGIYETHIHDEGLLYTTLVLSYGARQSHYIGLVLQSNIGQPIGHVGRFCIVNRTVRIA